MKNRKPGGRVACIVLSLVAVTAWGCVFEESRHPRHPVPIDVPRDESGLPDAAGDEGSDAAMDAAIDPVQDTAVDPAPDPAIDATPDVVHDVGLDTASDIDANCATPPDPVRVTFDVHGFPLMDGTFPPWGEGTIDGDGILESVQAEDGYWRYQFLLEGDRGVTVETSLPPERSIPFQAGDAVHLYGKQEIPWWRDLVLVLWDAEGTPRFLYHDATGTSERASWYDCGGGGRPCPSVRMLPDTCPAVEGECGTRQYPPVELLAFGGLASSEVPTALRQGFDGPSESNPAIHYRVMESYRIVPGGHQCVDYPGQWIRASIRLDAPPMPCDPAKIGFSRDNPARYEFYEICLPKGDEAAVDEVQAIDPSLYCGVSGHFAGCPEHGEAGCHGTLGFEDGTKVIDPESWSRLCALSLRKVVTRFGGGYWL